MMRVKVFSRIKPAGQKGTRAHPSVMRAAVTRWRQTPPPKEATAVQRIHASLTCQVALLLHRAIHRHCAAQRPPKQHDLEGAGETGGTRLWQQCAWGQVRGSGVQCRGDGR